MEDGYSYTGIDVSMQMLEYARKEIPLHHIHQMDMRDINLRTTFEGVIITARSISYILSNNDIMATFRSIKSVLRNGGVLIFDFIDAKNFIPSIKADEVILHEVVIDDVKYWAREYF